MEVHVGSDAEVGFASKISKNHYEKNQRINRPNANVVLKIANKIILWTEDQIQTWLVDGNIRPNRSEYLSAVVLVMAQFGFMLSIDYRKLNKEIVKDRFPMLVLDEQLNNSYVNQKLYSTIDF